MRSALLILAFCLQLLTALAQASPARTLDILPLAERMSLWPGLQVVAAGTRALTPKLAAELASGEEAISVANPAHILGRATQPYWALFSLHNPQTSELTRLLALETTTQFDTRLYRRNEGGEWLLVGQLSDAGQGRFGSGTPYPVWELKLASHQATELLLRIEGPSIVRFPLYLYQPAAFSERLRKTQLAIGIALGSSLFIAVYIVTLRRYLDDPSVPLFICMLFANLLGALWLSGFLAELFPSIPESSLSPIGFAAFAALFGCGSLHARVYMNTASWANRTDRLLQLLGWFWLGLAPWFALAFPVAARVLAVWGGGTVAAILVGVSVLAARRRIPFSGFIVTAWIAYLLVAASFALARSIDNPLVWPSSTLTLVQATVITILFGFAMSQRLMRHRDELLRARQEAEMQHEKSVAITRERSLLFAATNHDLRQPLFGISLFANLLRSANSAEEREEHALKLNLALKEVDDLLVAIQQLSAVNEAAHQPRLETVRLDELLLPVVEEYRGRSEYKRVTIRYVPSQLSITTHVPYFQRIVRNLLSNAIRYTDRGDRILIGCRRGGGLRLVIADTGRGMSEEQTKRAFEAFRRFDPQMSATDGFGLGLFSSKSLADALGIAISLDSEEGRGTEFRISMRPDTPAA